MESEKVVKGFFSVFRIFFFLFISAGGEILGLGEIEVVAPRFSPFRPTVSFSVDPSWTFLDMERRLKEVPGIFFRKTGWWESFSTLSLRGTFSHHTAVYLEELPLNSPFTGGWNLSEFPLSSVERVEIYTAPTSIVGAPQPIGGAIRLYLRSSPSTSFSFTSGSFSSRVFSFHHIASSGGISYRKSHSSGDFPYWNNNGTPENPLDDFRQYRQNNRISRDELLLRKTFSREKSLSASLFLLQKSQGLAGTGYVSTTQAHLDEDLASFLFQCAFCTPSYSLYFHHNRMNYRDLLGELSLQKTHNTYRTLLFGATAQYPLSSRCMVTFSSRAEWFRLRHYFSSRFPPLYRRSVSYLGVTFQKKTRWSGELGGEYTFFRAPWRKAIFLPTGWLSYTFPWQKWSISSQLWVGGRVPSFSEQFGDFGFLVPNSDLQEERGRGFAVSLRPLHQSFSAQFTFFAWQGKDWIVLWQNSQRSIQAYNAQSVQAFGWEGMTKVSWGKSSVLVQTTLLDAEDRSDTIYRGKKVPGVPDVRLTVSFSLPFRSLAKFHVEWEYVRKFFLDRANLYPVDHRNSLSLVWEMRSPFLHIRLDNLLNKNTQDFLGFPLPGRTFLLTFQQKL
ncbi:MAG: TonB-dependent receptor plug domain-containing protein [bacterium JZ-2024 1]